MSKDEKQNYMKKYREEHKEELKQKRKVYLKTNRDKHNTYQRNYQKNSFRKTETYRNQVQQRRFKEFGITEEYFKKLLNDQKGLCAICNNPISSKNLHIDHDHKNNKVRGLLCSKCNQGLGLFNENLDTLSQARIYLIYHNEE